MCCMFHYFYLRAPAPCPQAWKETQACFWEPDVGKGTVEWVEALLPLPQSYEATSVPEL